MSSATAVYSSITFQKRTCCYTNGEKMKSKKYIIFLIPLFLILSTVAGMILLNNDVISLNDPTKKGLTTHGLRVSGNYNINTENDFIFFCAVNRDGNVNASFYENWKSVKKSGIIKGAYLVFNYDKSGKIQAEQFIDTVPNDASNLPPMIYLDNGFLNKSNSNSIRNEIFSAVECLKNEYGKNIILCVSLNEYKTYVEGYLEDCSIWIRDTFDFPSLPDGRKWQFWEYAGGLIVFNGTFEDFISYYVSK